MCWVEIFRHQLLVQRERTSAPFLSMQRHLLLRIEPPTTLFTILERSVVSPTQ